MILSRLQLLEIHNDEYRQCVNHMCLKEVMFVYFKMVCKHAALLVNLRDLYRFCCKCMDTNVCVKLQ